MKGYGIKVALSFQINKSPKHFFLMKESVLSFKERKTQP